MASKSEIPKSKQIANGIVGIAILVILVIVLVSCITGGGAKEPNADTNAGTAVTTEQGPDQASNVLTEITAAQFLGESWESRFTYGATVHWIIDRITTENDDGTFTFKIGATVTNEFGAEVEATIEGDVGGAEDAPQILDSILYTGSGEVIDFFE